MKKTNKAFTLVELIVVITILAILSTIAFLSLQGYNRDARNSKRTSELEMIEKSLEIFYTNKGFYPDPNSALNITYLGSIARTQGTFGANQNLQLGSISDLPLDPLTLTEYAYSTTSLKNEYQIGAIYEGLITQNQNNQEILNKTYAGNQDGIAKVIGNYNGSILSVYSGATTFILAVPTIINGDMSLLDIQTIIGNGKLVYNGGNTLPGNYSGTIFDTTKTNTYYTNTGTMLVYSGTMQQLKTDQSARIQMLKNLQTAYSGTTFGQTDGNIRQIMNTVINTNLPSQQAIDLGVSTLSTSLKIRDSQINNNNYTPQCSSYTYSSSILGTTGMNPYGITIDSVGNIYTANSSSNNVSKITPSGVSTILGTTGNFPYGITIDSVGNIYTSNWNSNNVSKITPSGVSTILGTTGANPTGITIDSVGNVYTSNRGANNITKMIPTGSSSIIGTTGTNPYGITIDLSGNLYTANTNSNNVSKITPTGSSSILGTTGFNPHFIIIDLYGNIYTPNYSNNNVSKITSTGSSSILGTTGTNAMGITIDSSGNIYTANIISNNVTKFTKICNN